MSIVAKIFYMMLLFAMFFACTDHSSHRRGWRASRNILFFMLVPEAAVWILLS